MDHVDDAAAILARARAGVVLTGAGVSTESGLPDFRSPGGLWANVDPLEVATLTAFRRAPQKFYEFYRGRLMMLAAAAPNPAHRALADLEEQGVLVAVITQNIDGLHQVAGSRQVIELHGNLRESACPQCGWVGAIDVITTALEGGRLPRCEICGGLLKPNVVLFEELLPQRPHRQAEGACRRADVMLIAGSSLQVTPAAWLPEVAHRHGAAVIIVNEEPTPLDHLARAVLRGRAGEILPQLADAVRGKKRREPPS